MPGFRLIAGVLLSITSQAVSLEEASGALRVSSAADVVRSYIEALSAGEWDAAAAHWVPHAIAGSQRLGISYAGIHAKYDCTSPVVLELDAIRDGSIAVAIGAPGRVEDHVVVPVRLSSGEFGGADYPYHLVPYQETWRLASSLDVQTRRWPTRTARYVVLHYSDSSLVNAYALAEMDRFIDLLGRLLGLAEDRMRRLEREKIDYYLGMPADCERLVGVAVPGLTDLPSDAVITSYLPHRHEIVHLMINYTLGALPLYTLPWLQEGAAVSLGGRWGKSPRLMVQLGSFVVTNELVLLDDLLAFQGFGGSGGDDMSYAACGLLVSSLVARHGVERFLALYSRLSGDAEVIRAWTPSEIQAEISAVYGTPWETITAECAEFAQDHEFSGVLPGTTAPSEAPVHTLETDSVTVAIWESDAAYEFEVRSGTDSPSGAILVGCTPGDGGAHYRSRLFADQFIGTPYAGECYGIVFDTAEAGLYDYRQDILVAKYAGGFSPDSSFWQAGERVIRFRLFKSAVPQGLMTQELRLVSR